jgi:methylmalonyl-CoA mutase, C-terminal domain
MTPTVPTRRRAGRRRRVDRREETVSTPSEPSIRVLVAKPGLDGHDRGAKVVVKALRDGGMEVIYTGRHHTVASVLRTALDEDVEAIGLSVLSGAHMDYCRRLVDGLRAEGAEDVVLLVGGVIPNADVPALKEMGFAVFPTGSNLSEVVDFVRQRVDRRRAARVG